MASPAVSPETIVLDSIVIDNRIRGEMGDIDGLCTSIKEFGLIQPVVLAHEQDPVETDEWGAPKLWARLVAGGRRYNALRRLGVKSLQHGKHYIWREEVIPSGDSEVSLKMKGIELEENLRRKSLSWQEEVLGRKQLLEIMQKIYGEPQAGRLPRDQRLGRENLEVHQGFGVRKLAAMLNENVATISQQLKVAAVMQAAPELAKQPSFESAKRLLSTVAKVKEMQDAAKVSTLNSSGWELFDGKWQKGSSLLKDGEVDLIYTDLPFGVSLSQMSSHSGGTIGYLDDRSTIVGELEGLAKEAYRVLHEDRFAIFWFGFNYYGELLSAIEKAGLKFNPVPFVWFKNTRSTENPNTRYANAYDPAIVAWKGSPMFIRPGQQNFVSLGPVIGGDKLQVAQQPVELPEKFIRDTTAEGALIVDFCAGSGTTGVAAVKNKRRVVMFEREPAARMLIRARMAVLK